MCRTDLFAIVLKREPPNRPRRAPRRRKY